MKILYSVVVCLFLFSCSNQEQVIEPTLDFLDGQWRLDSTARTEQRIINNDFYFGNGKFWRFSNNDSSYILDKELSVVQDSIFDKTNLKYKIQVIDSNNIILKSNDIDFYCFRFSKKFEPNEIDNYKRRDSLKTSLNGIWEIFEMEIKDSIEFSPTSCYINLGSQINFFPEGYFHIMNQKDTCKQNAYKVYVYDNMDEGAIGEVSIINIDMVNDFNIYKLTQDTLFIKVIYHQTSLNQDEEYYRLYGKALTVKLKRVDTKDI